MRAGRLSQGSDRLGTILQDRGGGRHESIASRPAVVSAWSPYPVTTRSSTSLLSTAHEMDELSGHFGHGEKLSCYSRK